jgi:SPP1 family predicted phage head-tail adaptor
MTKPLAWPQIDPGKLVHRIQLQTQTMVGDSFGQLQPVWTTTFTTWASIEPVRGLDLIRSGQETTQLFLTVTIPWQAGVLAKMRVLTVDNEAYIIQSIEDPLHRHVILILNCLLLNEI